MACSSPVTVTKQVPAYTPSQQQCTGGRVSVNGQCVCPSGTQWNGTQCVTPTPQGQPPGQPGMPYTVNDSSAGLGYNASLTIGWSPASDTLYYNVIDPDSNRTIASNISGTQYTIPNLYSGATIHLAIVAVNQYGQTQGPTNQFVLPCPSGYTATGGGCQAPQTPANLTIVGANVPAVNPGQYATATVQVANTGDTAGSATVSGLTYDSSGNVIGHWTTATVTVQGSGTATASLQSLGQISSIYAGQELTVVFSLSTGGQYQTLLPVNSVAVSSGPSVQGCMNSDVVLQYGNTDAGTGGCVSALQNALNSIAQYYNNGCQQINVDGNFGPNTQQAVQCFQSWAGISVDGVVGPQTWQQIYVGLTGGL